MSLGTVYYILIVTNTLWEQFYMGSIIINPFRETWGTEMLSNFLKVTQVVSSGGIIWFQALML